MMLLRKKSSTILMLALLGTVSKDNVFFSGADAKTLGFGKSNVDEIVNSIAESFHLGDSPRANVAEENKSVDADGKFGKFVGLECVPGERKDQNAKNANSSGPDVGVLLSKASGASTCPTPNYVCQADPATFLGGRCVPIGSDPLPALQKPSRNVLGSKRLLQDTGYNAGCPSTCSNTAVCDCLENPYVEECYSVFESLCQNEEELSSCVDPYYSSQIKFFQCPLISCYENGGSYAECQCETNSSICDFCSSSDGEFHAICAFSESMCTAASCCSTAAEDTEKMACLPQGYAWGSSTSTMPTWISYGISTSTTATATVAARESTTDATTSNASAFGTEPAMSETTTATTATSATAPSSSEGDSNAEDDSNTEDEASSSEGNVDVATASQENSSGDVIGHSFTFVWAMFLSFAIINS